MAISVFSWQWARSLTPIIRSASGVLLLAAALSGCSSSTDQPEEQAANDSNGHGAVKLLNVSYDVARDFYQDYNPWFTQTFKQDNDRDISIQQSHGGSSKQALAVANGLQADVVSMNQVSDIDLLADKGLVAKDWASRLPNQSVPFTGITVFLVRKGNPKAIHGWDDLAKDGVAIVMANPKTTGNGRYAFLGAYGHALKNHANNQAAAENWVKKMLANVPVFENGGRAATTTFTQRNIGDVLITFENEANVVSKKLAPGQFEIVYPAYTILSESPVAVVDQVVDKKGTRAEAEAYLQGLWSEPAQELGAALYLRPQNEKVLQAHAADFPQVETFHPNKQFGSWPEIMASFFADGGTFDRLSQRH